MNMKSKVALIMAGVGGTVLFQQIKNGNFRRMMKKMTNFEKNMLEDMQDML